MQSKARDAFFDSIMTHRNVEQHLTLNVRRECLVEDSLKAVGEVVGSAGDEIKKGLRIIFRGEEGIDGYVPLSGRFVLCASGILTMMN